MFSFLDTYRKKFFGLLIGAFLFSLLAYWLTISKTVAARAEYQAGTARLASAVGVEGEIGEYSKKLNQLSGGGQVEGFSQENLFGQVAEFCEAKNITIRQMPEAEIIPQDNYREVTNLMELEGAYASVVELIYQLEQEWKYGKVVSADFEKQRNRESRQMELVSRIYLQNIEPIKR